jgi:hypothetical protein
MMEKKFYNYRHVLGLASAGWVGLDWMAVLLLLFQRSEFLLHKSITPGIDDEGSPPMTDISPIPHSFSGLVIA